MEFKSIINKFNFTNLVILDDTNYMDMLVKDIINESNSLYEELTTNPNVVYESLRISEVKQDPLLYAKIKPFYMSLNPYKWLDEIENEIQIYNCRVVSELPKAKKLENNTLWFIDLDINTKNYSHVNFAYEQFSENIRQGKNDLFIIFSNKAELYNNLDEIKRFCKDDLKIDLSVKDFIELSINFISKNNDFDSKNIYSMILKASKTKYLSIFKESVDKSLLNFENNIFETEKNQSIFHYDYLCEGEGLEDSFYNIINHELEFNYKDLLIKSQLINNMNDTIDYFFENLDEDLLKKEKILGRILKSINAITYANNMLFDDINYLKKDLGFGDILKVNNNYYMLANQSCDITIRENGVRRNKDAYLIPLNLEKLNKESINSYIKRSIVSIFKDEKIDDDFKSDILNSLKNKFEDIDFDLEKMKSISDDISFVLYKETHYSCKIKKGQPAIIPFWIIDSISCNTDGKVTLEYLQDGLRYPLKKRIADANNDLIKFKEKINNLEIDFISYMSIAYEKFFNESNKSISIIRLGRLNSSLAIKLQSDFADHQIRTPDKTILTLDC